MTKQLFVQDSQKKRKLSNVVLCYHGCVLGHADALIFREHIDDIKNQIIDLLHSGYRFVFPSEYDNWYEGAPGYSDPLAVIHLDDGLDSIIPLCEWLIDRQLPFGIGVISSRNEKYNPQQGFLRWSTLRGWVDTGYCEILRHTHNIHNLTITSADGYAAPVLEGPCWIDEPADVIYRKPGDTRWYWDFDIIDKTTWGFPLLGSDPYSNYATPITADIYYVADTTTTVTIIRFWAALHRPAGAGYDCTVEVIADGVSLGDYIITPKAYETRTQWVEREFYTLVLTTPFNITSGANHHLQFVSKNAGNGCFLLYVLPECENPGFYCVTSSQSLSPGKAGPNYGDFPAGRPWPGRAGIILASGAGRLATMPEYIGYIQADITSQNAAVENWLKADWYETPINYNTSRTRWSLFALAGCEENGDTITSIIKWQALRPVGYDPLASTMTLELLRFKQGKPFGARYAMLVKIEIGTTANGPWTFVGEWVPGWDYYKWVTIDINSTEVTIGASYFFRFTTLNRSYNADYYDIEDPDRPPDGRMYGTNVGKISVYLDQPSLNLVSTKGEDKFKKVVGVDLYGNEITTVVYYATEGTPEITGYMPEFFDLYVLLIDGYMYADWMILNSYRYPNYSVTFTQEHGIDALGHWDQWPQNIDLFDVFTTEIGSPEIFLDKIIQASDVSLGKFGGRVSLDDWNAGIRTNDTYIDATWYGSTAMYATASPVKFGACYGVPLFGGVVAVRNPSGIIYDQMIYPFGSFNADATPTADIKPVEGLSTELLSLFSTYGIRSGYTIWPSRNDLPGRFRESFCRCTAHTKSRMLMYGDIDQTASRSLISNYAALRWPDAEHGGIKWQIAIEPDNNGNATIRNSYAALDTVAFDAYFFRLPDVDHLDGWILSGELNDGGTYDSVVYADDKTFLQNRGVCCSLILSNYNDLLDDVDPDIASYVVNNAATFIPLIVSIATTDNWDGITCNLEGIPEADRIAATGFYQDLGRAMKVANKQLHITAPAKTNTDYDIGSEWWFGWCDHAAIIGFVDRMKIMTYTETGPGTAPGPHAPDWFMAATYDYIASVIPVEHRKRILVGANAFGHIWQDQAGAVVDYGSYHACMAEAITRGAQIETSDTEAYFNYKTISAWWATPNTINRAVEFAGRYGFGGVGIWKADDGDIDEHYPLNPQIGVIGFMSFLDIRFPDDIRYGFTGGPSYKVDIGESDNGQEQRSLRWTVPKYDYSADIRLIVNQVGSLGLNDLVAFFRLAKGPYHTFRFKDWADFRAVDSFIATADGVATAYQLRKTYQYGSNYEYRPITKPVADTLVVKVNSTVVSNYTLDSSTGIITFSSAPTNGDTISASFDFDVQVRFNMDRLPVVINDYQSRDFSQILLMEADE